MVLFFSAFIPSSSFKQAQPQGQLKWVVWVASDDPCSVRTFVLVFLAPQGKIVDRLPNFKRGPCLPWSLRSTIIIAVFALLLPSTSSASPSLF